MQGKTQKVILFQQYGKKLALKEVPIPDLPQGKVLVKVQASTINPSDRMPIQGKIYKKSVPFICGNEGTGTVVEVKGEGLQHLVGKRVCFSSDIGSWCEYAVASPMMIFEIEKDVPLSSAASGVINPLTAIGFVEQYRSLGLKGGIIHTAAASALGRQLNKLCQKQNIPLLNIVRRKEHSELLKKEGATNVIITEGEWVNEYKQYIKKGFDCIYDALGGGPVTDALISNLGPKSVYHIYGFLENKPIQLTNPMVLFSGVQITGFAIFPWWGSTSEETKNKIRNEYSSLLKNQLSSQTYKELKFKDIDEALELSVSKATEGKIMLKWD